MRVYTVHAPPFSSRDPDPVLIKEGFCWPAFLFGPLWSLAHRLWFVTVAVAAFLILLGAALDALGTDDFIQFVVTVSFAMLIGAHANDWRRRTLAKLGFREAGVVAARSIDEGLARFLDAEPARAPARLRANPVPPPPMPIAGL